MSGRGQDRDGGAEEGGAGGEQLSMSIEETNK